jgi:uncharacterized RDD family membrane protein YckC
VSDQPPYPPPPPPDGFGDQPQYPPPPPPPPPPGGGYGAPPPPGGYGAPPPPPPGSSGQPNWGQPYGAPQPTAWSGPPLADYGKRLVSGAIDYLAPSVVVIIVEQASSALGALVSLAALAFYIYNGYLTGTTGQSIGKQVAGTKVVNENTGQLIGPGLGIGRWLLHILDGLACFIGYLFPIWDSKRQTFADKIVHTVVIEV